MDVGRTDPRVCQVAALRGDGTAEVGSGFLIRGRRVVTARHVVVPEDFEPSAWRVRLVHAADWVDADSVVEAQTTDIAVLQVGDAAGFDLPEWAGAVPLGRITGGDPVPARAVGFPRATRQTDPATGLAVRHPEDARGELRPVTADRGAMMALHLTGSTPVEANDPSDSWWAGMSGAGVLAGRWLVGVIASDPARYGTDRLAVATLDQVPVQDPFWVGVGTSPDIETADRPVGLEPPFRVPRMSKQSMRLLHATYGLVPFTGRDVELRHLQDWCATSAQMSLQLVTGRGGEGKTRLAAELAERMADRGWLTGFISEYAGNDEIAGLMKRTGPKLLVIDYADSRVDQVLTIVARSIAAIDQVRVLLLSRRADRWWGSMANLAGDARYLFDEADELPLEKNTLTTPQREESFAVAVEAIARYMGKPVPTVRPELEDDAFDTRLFIHLAALTAVDPASPQKTSPTVAEQLLDAAIQREDDLFWKPTGAGANLVADDPVTRRRAVAVATLTAAADENAAIHALSSLPSLDETSAAHVAHWLYNLNPEPPYLSPLEPDRLGEHLVASALKQRPSLVADLVAATNDTHLDRILTVLTRAAHVPSAAAALRGLLVDQPEVEEFIDATAAAGDLTSGQLLTTAFLDSTWREQRIWSVAANGLGERINRYSTILLVLPVVGAALVMFGALMAFDVLIANSWEVVVGRVLGGLGTALLFLAPVVRTTRLGKGAIDGWIGARAVSEGLKREAYLYLSSANPYGGEDRDETLIARTRALLDSASELTIYAAGVEPDDKPPPPPMDADGYVTLRVNAMIYYYETKGAQIALRLRRLRSFEFALAMMAAGLALVATVAGFGSAALTIAAFVPVVTTAGATVALHIAAKRHEYLAATYSVTAQRLRYLRDKWLAGGDDRASPNDFVHACEDAISAENQASIALAPGRLKQQA